MEPLVSILIPVYNRVNLVGETIESAINQIYKNIEIVICDNLSSDGTWELLQQFAEKDNRIRIFRNEENIGPVRNWKRCIDESRGEYAKFLWSDDLIEPNFIYECLYEIQKNNKIGFVYTSVEVRDLNAKTSKIIYRYSNTGKFKSYDFVRNLLLGLKSVPVSPGNALFRTIDLRNNLEIQIENPDEKDFSKTGAGNDSLLFLNTCADYDYFYFIDKPLSIYKSHSESLTYLNDLRYYYTWSKIYFLEKSNRFRILRDQYFTLLYIKNTKNITKYKLKFKFKFKILVTKSIDLLKKKIFGTITK